MEASDLLNYALAEQELRRRKSVTIENADLFQIIPILSPRYEEPRHLSPAIEVLMATEFSPQRLIISVPPRHGKTETLLHYIAWFLKRNPHKTVAYVSYNSDISGSKALLAQSLMEKIGLIKNPRRANIEEWRTQQGGGLLTTSIGGKLTGFGVDVLIVDDPVKDRAEAESKTVRDKQWGWFEDVAETRLEPGASLIILQTRWHDDDLSGRVIKNRSDYTIIRIPALADGLDSKGNQQKDDEGLVLNLDPLGRALDAPLWPMRYGFEWFENIRNIKPYSYTSMYQGLPRDRDRQMFRAPTYYTAQDRFTGGYRSSMGGDLAYTAALHGNHSAITYMKQQGEVIQLDFVTRWREDINETVNKLEFYQKRFKIAYRLEANGPQKGVFGLLIRAGIKVIRADLIGDKYARTIELAEVWNAGLFQLPDPETLPNDWLSDYLEEMLNFTGIKDLEDDQVDASVHGFNGLATARSKAIDHTSDARGRVNSRSVSMVGGRARQSNRGAR